LSAISEIESLSVERQGTERTAVEALTGDRESNRLGEALLENCLITNEQLQAAFQAQKAEMGPSPLLGQVLIRMGLVNQEVLDQVIAEQKEKKQGDHLLADPSTPERSRGRTGGMPSIEKTVRTSVERLDNLMNLVGELITDRNRLNLVRSGLESRFHGDDQVDALAGTIMHIGRITDQLQAEVMGIRMLPISNVFNKFPRLVRDLGRMAGKQVDLVIRGEDTELDRSVIEVISDPLIHLLRNAVDHGLEKPQERLATGKPERGVILLTARHEQGRIIVTVEDNGRGINLDAVRAKAVEKGQITRAEADAMSNEDARDLIFTSGLSTARVVSDVSGRGVGMDIVRSNIERLNGSVLVETWPGRGTQFQIVLPLTLAIVPTLLVRVGKGTFAIPLVTVIETLRVSLSDIQTVNGRPVVLYREHILPVASLSHIFQFKPNGRASRQSEYVVIVRSGKSQMGLIVDALVGEQEVVVKSLSTMIGEANGISSAAILGDGQVALIIDVQGLFKLATLQTSSGRMVPAGKGMVRG
jgi:two-component system chemotaxis sensor kinase CheA